MEWITTAAIVLIIYWIVNPVIEWWCDRSAYYSPPEGYTKKEWKEVLKKHEKRREEESKRFRFDD